jgi:hypothetical protein
MRLPPIRNASDGERYPVVPRPRYLRERVSGKCSGFSLFEPMIPSAEDVLRICDTP